MSNDPLVRSLVSALTIPTGARVDKRVPKKLFLEHGAPTAADKRHLQEGIEEIEWLAALKASTIGIAAYQDNERDYLEIQVLKASLRPAAKNGRMTELIHRAVPYPLVLLTLCDDQVSLSLAHKRNSRSEAGTVVLEGAVVEEMLHGNNNDVERLFLRTLPIASRQVNDLLGLYEHWMVSLIALQAAKQSGRFALTQTREQLAARQQALSECTKLRQEVASLRSVAQKEQQMNKRVELNLAIQELETQLRGIVRTL